MKALALALLFAVPCLAQDHKLRVSLSPSSNVAAASYPLNCSTNSSITIFIYRVKMLSNSDSQTDMRNLLRLLGLTYLMY